MTFQIKLNNFSWLIFKTTYVQVKLFFALFLFDFGFILLLFIEKTKQKIS